MAFRGIVLLGLALAGYFTYSQDRYLVWATLVAMLLALLILPTFGQVAIRDSTTVAPDPLPTVMMSGKASFRRLVITVGLILLGLFIAWLGQWVLDNLMAIAPQWSSMIERIGSGLIAIIIMVTVLLPLYRLYGVFDKRE
jgi:hypothetical protein